MLAPWNVYSACLVKCVTYFSGLEFPTIFHQVVPYSTGELIFTENPFSLRYEIRGFYTLRRPILSKEKDLTQKMFDYVALLEKTNDDLVFTLKESVELLAQFKEWVPNPQGWQDMLDAFQETINVGERVTDEKVLH